MNAHSSLEEISSALRYDDYFGLWHPVIVLLQWALLALGVIVLLRRKRSLGVVLMLISLVTEGVGGLVSPLFSDYVNRHQMMWIPYSLWTFTTLLFCVGFIMFAFDLKKEPNQPPQTTPVSAPR